MTKRETVLDWWETLSSAQKTHICDTNTELIGRVRRHESLTYRQVELLFDVENTLNLEISEMVSKNILWVNGDDRLPTESDWFIGYIKGIRLPLRYNAPNRFWMDFTGETYQPNEIDRWLDA